MISVIQFILGVFLYMVLQNKSFEQLGISNLYFGSFVLFWIGFKLIAFFLYQKHSDCLFMDVYELWVVEFMKHKKIYIWFPIGVRLILFFIFYYHFLKIMHEFKSKFKRFLDYNS